MFTLKVFLILSFFVYFTNSASLVSKPLINAFPCNGTELVSESFSQDESPETENMYNLFIKVNKTLYPNKLPPSSSLYLLFDTTTNLTLIDNFGRIYPQGDGKFQVKFHTAVENNLSMKVRGRRGKPVPNLLSVILNGDELCPDGVKTGFWDPFILGDVTSGFSSFIAPSSSDPGCGRKKVEHIALIVHGEETKPGDWPWHVAVYRINSRVKTYICGGTLISTSRVLTAGHCVVQSGQKVIPERLYVVLGKYNLAGTDLASQELGVHEIDLHEDFDPAYLKNDIAMLVLLSDVSYGDYIQPICLWDVSSGQTAAFYEKLGYVVGWGASEHKEPSNTLTQATMPIVRETTCLRSNVLFFERFLTPNTYCAGWKNGTSVCNGDSGGGMFLPEEGDDGKTTWRLRGIVSLSVSQKYVAMCDPNQYVIFTDITKYIDWIEDRL